MPIRRNLTQLSSTDRAKYVQAVLTVKQQSRYDWYVNTHMATMNQNPMQAHQSPMFLPWHRQFLLQFEADLLKALGGTSYAVPYWDWAADQALPDPTHGVVWGTDFMGGTGNPVTTGPFQAKQWTLAGGGSLVRTLGYEVPTLPSAADVSAALGVPVYDSAPWNVVIYPPAGYQSFRDQLEGWLNGPTPQLHNRVHAWVGGSMIPMTSPNDPVFFLHHANIDRIWRQWQQAYSPSAYLPASGVPGVSATDAMWPWNGSLLAKVTPNDVLSTVQLGYIYDTEIQRTTPFGGPHGDPFDDSAAIQKIPSTIVSVYATWNTAITSLAITYADGVVSSHGQQVKDNSRTFELAAGEAITSITVFTNKQHDKTGVAALKVTISDSTSWYIGPVPQPVDSQVFTVANGRSFAGFCGEASNRIYSLGIVTLPSS